MNGNILSMAKLLGVLAQPLKRVQTIGAHMEQVWVVYIRGTQSLVDVLACFVP